MNDGQSLYLPPGPRASVGRSAEATTARLEFVPFYCIKCGCDPRNIKERRTDTCSTCGCDGACRELTVGFTGRTAEPFYLRGVPTPRE